MAFGAFVLSVSAILGEHDQKLVDRHAEANQGTGGSLDRKIRE